MFLIGLEWTKDLGRTIRERGDIERGARFMRVAERLPSRKVGSEVNVEYFFLV